MTSVLPLLKLSEVVIIANVSPSQRTVTRRLRFEVFDSARESVAISSDQPSIKQSSMGTTGHYLTSLIFGYGHKLYSEALPSLPSVPLSSTFGVTQ